MVASGFIAQGYQIKKILAILQIPTSCWYYKSTGGKPGLRASTHTFTLEGKLISNVEVVQQIETLLQQDFVDYGYIKVTHWLRQKLKLIINFKKVYRLMKENSLLYHQHKRDRKGKVFIEFRVPKPEVPFEHMEMDIKFIWIHAASRMAYLLSVIDIKTRAILGWLLQYSIRKNDVIDLIQAVASCYCLPRKVTIRSDNGSQFEAKIVREYLHEIDVQQEFSHVATPQDNGHIDRVAGAILSCYYQEGGL
jgi:transposase InsO family protein